MARLIYNQSVGNPIQRNQLPRTRPTQEWPAASDAEIERYFRNSSLSVSAIAGGAGVFAGVCFAPLLPTVFLVIPAAIIGMILCHEFAKHYIYRSTVAPMARPTAEVLRARLCQRGFYWCPLFVLGLLPFVLNPLPHPGHLFIPTFSTGLLWAGILAAISTCADRWPETVRAFGAALTSWCAYNRAEVDVPGTFQSPSGNAKSRVGLMVLCGGLTGSVIGASAVGAWRDGLHGPELQRAVSAQSPEPLLNLMLKHGLELVLILVAPLGVVIGLLFLAAAPVLADCDGIAREAARTTTWPERMESTARSPDPIERESYHLGFVDHDRSPFLLWILNLLEHAWLLGRSGAGKTNLTLSPLIEWLAALGLYSLVILDLKGDDLALYHALQQGTARGRRRQRQRIPLKYFTNELGNATYAFNPLNQSNRSRLSTYQLTHNICAAMNAIHGVHYGERWFSLAALTVVYETFRHFRGIASLKELSERLDYFIVNAKRDVLNNEVRKAGLEPQLILRQLAAISALNVTAKTHPQDVCDQAIDFSGPRSPFTEPQSYYFHLSTALGPGGAGEIGRLVLHSLMTAAKTTPRSQRRCPVFVVIDEWPEMISGNLAYILRQARSMGMSIILANQSMQDVRSAKLDLLPVLMENCNFKQWFSVSNLEDQRNLIELSGQTVEHLRSVGQQHGPQGTTISETYSEIILPRLNINDLRLASEDQQKSIVQITSGKGYARYGGFPLVMHSDFHISREEFERRSNAEWPEGEPGTFPASEDDELPGQSLDSTTLPQNNPIIENETIERPKRRSRRNRGNDRKTPPSPPGN